MPRACAHDVWVESSIENASCRANDDNSAATSVCARPLYTGRYPAYAHARAQYTEISIPKRDGHTYIHTYIHTDAK